MKKPFHVTSSPDRSKPDRVGLVARQILADGQWFARGILKRRNADWTPLPGCPGAMYLGPRHAMPHLDAIEFRMRIWFPPMLEAFYYIETISRDGMESFHGFNFMLFIADRMVGNYKAFMRGEQWVRS